MCLYLYCFRQLGTLSNSDCFSKFTINNHFTSALCCFPLDAALATVGSVAEVLYVDTRTIDAVVLADSTISGASVICRSINILFTLVKRLRHVSS